MRKPAYAKIKAQISTFVFRYIDSTTPLLPKSKTGRGSSVCSVSALQAAVPQLILVSGTFFRGKKFPYSTDSRRASCQLLAKEWALNTG